MANTKAGWYDDGSGKQRWWDGENWTNNFQEPQRGEADIVERLLFRAVTPDRMRGECTVMSIGFCQIAVPEE